MPNTAIYARKSTESEDQQILSIDSQVRELKEYADRQGLKIDSVHTESRSAKSPGRTEFKRLLHMVNRRQIDKIVCWKLDRLARNPVDGGALIWALEEGKLSEIHTPQQSFKNTGSDKFWMQLEFGMAKKYVDDLSDNVKRGRRAKIELGWLPGKPPIGYMNDRESSTIVPDPDRFVLIRRMWELMLSGTFSPRQIWDIAIYKWGLRTKRTKRQGDKPMAISAVYKMFRTPFYYGAIQQRGQLYPGKHKRMVSKADFNQVQILLGGATTPRTQKNVFAYTGMMRCGECGAAITAEHKMQRYGHRYVYYHCTKRRPGVQCSQRVIEVKELEQQIRAFLDCLVIPKWVTPWVSWVLEESHSKEREREEAEQESRRRRLRSCESELSQLTIIRIRGLVTDTEYADKRRELEQERERIQLYLQETTRARINMTASESFPFTERIRNRFDEGSLALKRAILKYTGSEMTLLDRVLSIKRRAPFMALLLLADRI